MELAHDIYKPTRTNTRWTPEEIAIAERVLQEKIRPCDAFAWGMFPGRNKQFVWNIVQLTKKRMNGLCACGRRPPAAGFATCDECREGDRQGREAAMAQGLCTHCRKRPAGGTLTMCVGCTEYHDAYNPKSMGTGGGHFRGLIRWMGSASLEGIVPHLPPGHLVVDLFGGSAYLTLKARAAGHNVVYNDIHPALCDLVRVLRDESDAAELLESTSRSLTEMPIADTVALYRQSLTSEHDMPAIQRASIFAFLAHNVTHRDMRQMEFGGLKPLPAGYVSRMRSESKLLRSVVVRNLDFAEVISIYDGPNTVFVIDPPFLNAKSPYEFGMTAERHAEMVQQLTNIRGKFFLTTSSSREAVVLMRHMNLWWRPTRTGSMSYRQVAATNYPVGLEPLDPQKYGIFKVSG